MMVRIEGTSYRIMGYPISHASHASYDDKNAPHSVMSSPLEARIINPTHYGLPDQYIDYYPQRGATKIKGVLNIKLRQGFNTERRGV